MAAPHRIRHNLETRSRVVQAIRDFFATEGFLEVETPIRYPCPAPEANIEAIPCDGWYLSTSPELHMKRLLADGYHRIFQICKCFRRGESGRLHNPEFTMLEWYRADGGYLDMLRDMERLVEHVYRELGTWPVLKYGDLRLDLRPPWQRLAVADAFQRFAGWAPGPNPDPDRFDVDMVEKVEPALGLAGPTVLLDYPVAMASLARTKKACPGVAERLEVYVASLELANAFTELADRPEQERRFREENDRRLRAGKQVYPWPERFLAGIERMPPAGGCALGVDRLVMLLCNARSIDEVMAFTAASA